MAIISDVGSPEFYELRAIEEIREAQISRDNMKQEAMLPFIEEEYHQHMTKAIQLLLLARLNV